MRLILTTALVLLAFAGNSILNRLALIGGEAGPAEFALIRTAGGAVALVLFARLGGFRLSPSPRHVWSGATLALYMIGFSFAYVTLETGVGALILFGGVQLTMFAGAVLMGERPPAARWIGSLIGMAGLAWLFLPGSSGGTDPAGAALMAAAALGFGIYSLIGRGSPAPLPDTAVAFVVAAPLTLAAWLLAGGSGVTPLGWALALVSGIVTSATGYALWYWVLGRIASATAALLQLTVPVIALLGGVAILGERPGLTEVLAGALVLGGVAFGILGSSARAARADRS